MSNADFQDRLQRIGAASAGRGPTGRGTAAPGPSGKQAPNHGLLLVGALFMGIGLYAGKAAISGHDAAGDSGGLGTAGMPGLIALAALLIGAVIVKRAMRGKAGRAQQTAAEVNPVRQTSTRARVLSSLLGFGFGVAALLYIFIASAARHIETEKAETLVAGSHLIVSLLLLISLFFGVMGLFVRGFALVRVPIYFLLGAVLSFACVKLARINLLEWPAFVAFLQ